jgi:hypothetical protein
MYASTLLFLNENEKTNFQFVPSANAIVIKVA